MSRKSKDPYGPAQSRKRLSSGDLVGLIILFLVAMSMVGLFFWKSQAAKKHVPLDPITYCPRAGPYGKTALLIDLTDVVSVYQEQRIRNLIKSLSKSSEELGIAKHEVLEIYFLSEEDAEVIPSPVIRACNPGDGAGIDEFTGNPQLANKRFTEAFLEPLDDALSVVGLTKPADVSPIIEAVRGISVSSFTTGAEPGHSNKLIIVSDMLQNSGQLSFYRGDQSKDRGQLSRYAADLAKVDSVDLKVLDRGGSRDLQGKALVNFWREYFRASGSNLSSAERWSE